MEATWGYGHYNRVPERFRCPWVPGYPGKSLMAATWGYGYYNGIYKLGGKIINKYGTGKSI